MTSSAIIIIRLSGIIVAEVARPPQLPPHQICGAISSINFGDTEATISLNTLHGLFYGPKRAQLLISTERVDASR